MKFAKSYLSIAAMIALSSPTAALADPPGNGGLSTIGDMLKRVIENMWNPLLLLIAIIAGVTGIYMMGKGLLKLSEAANERGGRGMTPGFAFILAGALLVALPDVAGVGMSTLFSSYRGQSALDGGDLDYNDKGMNGDLLSSITGGVASVGKVENCLSASDPAVCMAKNIATNAVPMGIMAIFSLVFLAGLASFGMTIMEMAKGTEGQQGGRGHLTKLVMAAMLMNAPIAFGVVTSTMFGTISSPINDVGLNASSSLLTYTSGSEIAIVKKYSEFIGYAFTVLAFFGAWAYVRGIFMVKGVAEAGRNAGSYGMAGVYVVAGVLMANAKASTCTVLTTVGGQGMGSGFCG